MESMLFIIIFTIVVYTVLPLTTLPFRWWQMVFMTSRMDFFGRVFRIVFTFWFLLLWTSFDWFILVVFIITMVGIFCWWWWCVYPYMYYEVTVIAITTTRIIVIIGIIYCSWYGYFVQQWPKMILYQTFVDSFATFDYFFLLCFLPTIFRLFYSFLPISTNLFCGIVVLLLRVVSSMFLRYVR